MTPQESSSDPVFTSFRILGKKAQKLLRRARKELQRGAEKEQSHALPPSQKERPEVLMHVSVGSVIQTAFTLLLFILGTWFIVQIQDKIILLLLAFFVAAIMDTGVSFLESWGIPRSISVLLHYLLFLFLFVFLLVSLIPIIALQLQQIALFISIEVNAFISDPYISLPFLTESINARLTDLTQATLQSLSLDQLADAIRQFGQNLSAATQGSLRFAAQLAGSVLNFFVSLIVVLVLAFFIQLEKERIQEWFRSFVPRRYKQYLDYKTEAIHLKIGQWARGQLLLSLSIAILVFIALTILRMPYALTLAALAGFTEFIPFIGPLIAAIPAVLIALTQEGTIWALIVICVYYVIQWCENNLLVPLVMKRAVGLSPVVVTFALMLGVSFPNVIHPLLGILLAVPIATLVALFVEDWRMRQERATS